MSELIGKLAEIDGAGGDGKIKPQELLDIQAALRELAGKAEEWATARTESLRTRFNRWSGQSIDGRKWAKNCGYEPVPFDGSSDQRVWWVDQTIREQETLRTVALARATLRCEPRNGAKDDEQAQALTVLLRWLRDRLGQSWYEEHRKLTNYELGDSPAVALMRVWWRSETKIVMQKMDVEQLATLWQAEYAERAALAGGEPDPMAVQQAMTDFAAALTDPEAGDEELAELLTRFFPRLTTSRAKKAVRQIRKDGTAEIPVPEVSYEGPAVSARRFAEDFIVPDNMREFDACPMWFEPEWLTKVQLLERQATDGWDKDFVADVLKQDGQAAVPEYDERDNGLLSERSAEDRKGAYQVVWVWSIAANDDGLPAKYYSVIHMDSAKTAFGRRIYRAPGNRWPGVFHRREFIDKWALNSRSVAEIEGPGQFGIKLLRDVAVDNANIGGLPPFVTFGHSNKGSIDLGPLAHLPLRQGGDARFMQPPAFPAAARQVSEDMRTDRNRYWGRASEEVDTTLSAMQREADIAAFMDRVHDELQLILDLALTSMAQEEITRILDEAGVKLSTAPADLAGQYDVRIIFDPADLDVESVIKRCEALSGVMMAMDVDKTIDTSRFVEYGVRALFPQLAGDGLRPQQEGLQKELDDESKNYHKLRAGEMPAMNTEGAWNYEARVQYYNDLQTNNPDVFADLAMDKQVALKQWIEALQQQAQQYGENVAIGRTGAAGVREE
jgi:hypothetical protein